MQSFCKPFRQHLPRRIHRYCPMDGVLHGEVSFAMVEIMVAILEKAWAREKVLPLSVKAYHGLGELGVLSENTELLRGVVFEQMPKSPRHTFLVLLLCRMLSGVLPPHLHLRQEQPLTCRDSEPEPGLAVVEGRLQDYAQQHPSTALLVIEVALSSENLDREKISIYAEAGVTEHWLVLAGQRRVEVYRDPVDGRYCSSLSFGEADILRSSTVPEFEVKLAELFAA
jgi:Uma2 family endonuclease